MKLLIWKQGGVEEGFQEWMARLRRCELVSYWEEGMAVAAFMIKLFSGSSAFLIKLLDSH